MGAEHDWCKIEGTDLMECMMGGTFAPQGVSAPTITSPTEGAWTVTRTGAGAYLVKFKNAVPRIKSATFSVSCTTANIAVQGGPIVQATAIAGGTTFAIFAYTANTGVAFEIPANAQNLVSFMIEFSNDNTQSVKN